MGQSMSSQRRADLLTTVDRLSPAGAHLLTVREKREKCARLLRKSIAKADVKLAAVCDKDHGQLSREIDDKEKLSIHEMYARWDRAVLVEFLVLLLGEFGAEVERTIRITEKSA